MLRLTPSAIVLGRSDLVDYEKRQQRRTELEKESINQQFARIAVGGPDGRRFDHERSRCLHDAISAEAKEEPLPKLPSLLTDEDTQSLSPASEGNASDTNTESLHKNSHDSIEQDQNVENPGRASEPRSSAVKNEFDYGGFIESLLPQDADNALQRSSPFSAPDSLSTPQHAQNPDARRLRWRPPLPRSPLFLSQNATSPDRCPTTRLTPRVASRVATHNTPGIIFAQPPRRPPRSSQLPRTFRHQANSFSFDSLERASAVYEQERVISSSTDEATPRGSDEVSLHDELRGSSLHSSRVGSAAPMHEAPRDNVSPVASDTEEEANVSSRDFIFSSPGFPLPPPFSSVSRCASNAESLPSTTNGRLTQNPVTSPVRSISSTLTSTPNTGEGEGSQTSNNASPVAVPNEGEGSPPSGGRIAGFILHIASYRARSPLNRGIPSAPPSASTSFQSQDQQTSRTNDPQTPSRSYRVYNDALSPDTQPQTPANLPEVRHQSRYHASYTAPVTRNAERRGPSSIGVTDRVGIRGSIRRREPLYTPVRGGRRTDSPTGLRDEGFEGLYGGQENGDEEQNWVDGIRSNNTETQLWGARNARNDGGALRETPEPEDWRVGRRP